MRFVHEDVVWQEVPGEVALAYTISGCSLRCPGCHSAATWPAGRGTELTDGHFSQRLTQYAGLLSCVLFLGGEWHEAHLISLLRLARERGLRTCLYTGQDDVSPAIRQHLTYLKTGRWIKALGGLESPQTNQRFTDLRSNRCLNNKFIKLTESQRSQSYA